MAVIAIISTLTHIGPFAKVDGPTLYTGIEVADLDAIIEGGRRYQITTRTGTRKGITEALASIGWTVADAKKEYAKAEAALVEEAPSKAKRARISKAKATTKATPKASRAMSKADNEAVNTLCKAVGVTVSSAEGKRLRRAYSKVNG